MTQRPVMRQSWRDLLFLHFPCDANEVQTLLPRGLQIETFPDAEGIARAWVGLVPFTMRDVRWASAPPFPGAHTFPETNVRTYVTRNGADPGVWFFSLDAMNRLAVRVARAAFALPYFYARMEVRREGDRVAYVGTRRDARYEIEASLGEPLAPSAPGSLERFLVERYRLYAARGDRLWSGLVQHPPYALRAARVAACEESLVQAAGLSPHPFVHAVFSEGVDVEVFPLKSLKGPSHSLRLAQKED